VGKMSTITTKEKDELINDMEILIEELEQDKIQLQNIITNESNDSNKRISDLEADFKISKTMYASLNNEKYYWKSMTVDLRKEKSDLEAKLKASEARNA
jgi:hypothetical protein